MISNFNSIYRSNAKLYIFYVLFFVAIEMPFARKEKAFCVRVCSNTVKQECAVCIYERIHKKCTNCNANLDMAQNVQRGKLSVLGKRNWTTDLTSVMSQAVHILKTSEIIHRIHISLNFSFKFWCTNLILPV